MAVLTEAAVRELASITGEGAPITSCYLDVDGRRYVRHQDLEHAVDLLLRQARARSGDDPSVRADLARIEQLVHGGFKRSRVRGLAIFACSATDLWQVIELPVRVESRIVVNQVPAVGQLEAVLRHNEPIGVLMADRQHARMFVFELGELVERSELFEPSPRPDDTRGERDRGGDHPHHFEERVQQHLRHAAAVAFDVWRQYPFEHLALSSPDPLVGELEAQLHPYLRSRVAGRLNVPISASCDEILAEAQAIEAEVERRREAKVVDRLRQEVAAGRRGVAGLSAVIDALTHHRVDSLVVSRGYAAPGWRCERCGSLAVMGRDCRRCGDEMTEVDDVVEEAVDEALSQSCEVDFCVGNADLDVLGRIGALLRY